MDKWSQYEKRCTKNFERDAALKDWIRSVPDDNTKAFCSYCKCTIRAHCGDLVNRAERTRHKSNAAPFSNARTLHDVGCDVKIVDNSVKVAELKLAAHVACHSSIATVDHISGKDIALQRTKCSALIKNVIGTAVHEELISDLVQSDSGKETAYSLIIDESTDIGLQKQLCVMVRYYSSSQKSIVTTFLGILSVESGTAEGIFTAITEFLNVNKVPINKCLGLATDGCNTLCGKNNSVMTRFREVCPDIKCICHSLQLSSSHALQQKTIPGNVEVMISETYNWFAHSTIRRLKYNRLFECINVGEQSLKILKLSDTRWLFIAACVQRVLDQNDEMKLNFQIVKDELRDYTAELLYQMLSSLENKLYLMFFYGQYSRN